MAHQFHGGIFREYDIRGIAGVMLGAQDGYLIARAFATRLGVGATCALGRDGRLSSPELREAVCRGLVEGGIRVMDVGVGPSPMLYFAARNLNTKGGMMITGSHNPADHNGFKFVFENHAFFGDDIQGLRRSAEHEAFSSGKGSVENKDVHEAYTERLLKDYRGTRALKIAWDAGNGAAGEIMSELAKRLPGEHVVLNEAIDGRFPVHHPDPSVAENLVQLIDTVKKKKLDVGIAFDGDGDRIGVIDDEGEILWGDQLLMLYGADILRARPGAIIIADIKASQSLFDEVARLGGKPLMCKTGHSLIKSKMAETGALLAGEMSGHIFFADEYYGYDDALYAAVRLLSLLSRSGKKLSDLRKALPRCVNTPEIRFPCADERKFVVIDEVKARLQKAGAEFNDIDGIRIARDGGWWLLRASNTQPMLVARAEAPTLEKLEILKAELKAQLVQSGVELP